MDANEKLEEIEITPEMIEAGLEAYSVFSSQDRGEWVICAIYEAMFKARPQTNRQQL
jgi:hypothetical protein